MHAFSIDTDVKARVARYCWNYSTSMLSVLER